MNSKNPYYYFDYASSSPLDPKVLHQMMSFLEDERNCANPSSSHAMGKFVKDKIDDARKKVAALIQAETEEIIWTSGATESNNLALKGAAILYKSKGKHIITQKTEHPSVIQCCQQLEKEGFEVTYLTPEKNGVINLAQLENAIRADTFLISIMHVNNETGIIQPIETIAAITSQHHILFHTDAAQSVGKLSIDLKKTPIDLMSFCAHKMYGPKGIGALYVRRKPRVRVAPLIVGGGQEQGMRSGTLATHQIIGFGEACSIAKEEMKLNQEKIKHLRDYFLRHFNKKNFVLNTDLNHAIPNIININLNPIKATFLIDSLKDIAISAGSACSSKGIEPSYVLRAMGLSKEDAECSIRISFGPNTTESEIDYLIQKIKE